MGLDGQAIGSGVQVRAGERLPSWTLVGILTALFACIAAYGVAGAYTPDRGFGYALGVAGASMMAVLLLYPIRKHVPLVRNWVPLKHWLAMHMIFGIAGPLLVLLHSTFRLRSLNATVAIVSMMLVAVSGVAGRFLYRKIQLGLDDARAASRQMQDALARELAAVECAVQPVPAVGQELERFAALVAQMQQEPPGRGFQGLALGIRRRLAQRRIANVLARVPADPGSSVRARLDALERTSCSALRATQQVAQFAAYERLFSLWRIVHVPIVFMLVISVAVHVVAVHAY